MPRYYFDIWEAGELRLDSNGAELPDDSAAEREARRILAEIGRHHLPDAVTELRLVMRDTFRPILNARLRLDVVRQRSRLHCPGARDVEQAQRPRVSLTLSRATHDKAWASSHGAMS